MNRSLRLISESSIWSNCPLEINASSAGCDTGGKSLPRSVSGGGGGGESAGAGFFTAAGCTGGGGVSRGGFGGFGGVCNICTGCNAVASSCAFNAAGDSNVSCLHPSSKTSMSAPASTALFMKVRNWAYEAKTRPPTKTF
ncbi:TPA: hypothetical protein DDW35_05905 [Candidatus Sumerlaeota bacterium]|nr:hypothetical protein [Candidatus Sumerlaeota bacterium]